MTKKQQLEIQKLVKGTGARINGNRIEWRDRYGLMALPLTSNPVGLVKLALRTRGGGIMDDYDSGRATGLIEAVELLGGERV